MRYAVCLVVLVAAVPPALAQRRTAGTRMAPITPRDVPNDASSPSGAVSGPRIVAPGRPLRATPTRQRVTAPPPAAVFTPARRVPVTYVGPRAYPHYVLYPVGGYYPVYYPSSPWAAQEYDDPALAGLAVDEAYLELHVLPPDAVVSVDGRSVANGSQDGDRVTVRPGSHWIEVWKKGYRTELYQINVGAARVHPVRVQLQVLPPDAPREPELPAEKGSGTLKLKVAAQGARIFVDGEPWGDARADAPGFMVLPAGDHSVRVEWPGERPFISNVHVHAGATQTLSVDKP